MTTLEILNHDDTYMKARAALAALPRLLGKNNSQIFPDGTGRSRFSRAVSPNRDKRVTANAFTQIFKALAKAGGQQPWQASEQCLLNYIRCSIATTDIMTMTDDTSLQNSYNSIFAKWVSLPSDRRDAVIEDPAAALTTFGAPEGADAARYLHLLGDVLLHTAWGEDAAEQLEFARRAYDSEARVLAQRWLDALLQRVRTTARRAGYPAAPETLVREVTFLDRSIEVIGDDVALPRKWRADASKQIAETLDSVGAHDVEKWKLALAQYKTVEENEICVADWAHVCSSIGWCYGKIGEAHNYNSPRPWWR